MYYIEETTCDIVWTLWRPRSHSALPVVIRRPVADTLWSAHILKKTPICWESTMQNDPLSL